MSTADYRDTQFEIANIEQRASGWVIKYTERARPGQLPPPPLPLSNDDLTKEEMAVMVKAFTILEVALERVHEAHNMSPDRAREAMAQALHIQRETEAKIAEAKRQIDEQTQAANEKLAKAQSQLAEAERLHMEILISRSEEPS